MTACLIMHIVLYICHIICFHLLTRENIFKMKHLTLNKKTLQKGRSTSHSVSPVGFNSTDFRKDILSTTCCPIESHLNVGVVVLF